MMHAPRARSSIALVVLVLGILLLGCPDTSDRANPDSDASSQGLPEGHVPISGSSIASAGRQSYLGTVLETMDAGGYTYARLAIEGTEAWFAGPPTLLAVGDELLVADALPMEDFTSPSLARTFDVVYFLRAFRKEGEAEADPGSAAGPGAVRASQGTVEEVLVGGGYTYVRVDVEGEPLWLAAPITQVSEGQTVSWYGGTPMDGFKSSTLDRTFEKMLFVEGIEVGR